MFNRFSSFLAFIVLGCVLLVACSGCSVNVIVAPNATLSIDSDLSQNASQEVVQ